MFLFLLSALGKALGLWVALGLIYLFGGNGGGLEVVYVIRRVRGLSMKLADGDCSKGP